MTPILIATVALCWLGVVVWASLPRPAIHRDLQTRHWRNRLARIAERRTHVVFWMLRRKFVTKGD
jgi:hypothetical protein